MNSDQHNPSMDKSMEESMDTQTTSTAKQTKAKTTKGRQSKTSVSLFSQSTQGGAFNAARMFELQAQQQEQSATNNNNTYETSYQEPNHIGNEESEAFQFVPNEGTYQQVQIEESQTHGNFHTQQQLDLQQQELQHQQTLGPYPQNFQAPYVLQEEFKENDMQAMLNQDENVRAAQALLQNMMTQTNQIPTQMVSTQTIAPFMKNKKNAYQIFANEAQYYLPPYDECSLDFLRDLLSGKKKCFKNSQIRMIKVPKLEELTAKKIMDQIMDDESLQFFLPDLDKLKRPLNREYLFNIINTVKPGFFERNIPHAYKVRKENAEAKKLQMIEICQEMLEAIQNSNQRVANSGKGRALALLTLGSKDKKRRREKPQKQKFDTLIGLRQVDSIQEYMDTMDFGTPRQFKKARRHYQVNGTNGQDYNGGNDMREGNRENNNPNHDFILVNQGFSAQASISGGGGSKHNQALDYSATTTKSRLTVESGNRPPVNQFFFDPNKINVGKQNNSNGNMSGISATSQAQPQIQQRRLL